VMLPQQNVLRNRLCCVDVGRPSALATRTDHRSRR
jgi:hypothetical protein